MLKSTNEILDEIAELHCLEVHNTVMFAIQQMSQQSSIEKTIEYFNVQLDRLYMPYRIESVYTGIPSTWVIKYDIAPKKLNFEELMYPTIRSEQVYSLLLKPFKDANVIYPKTLLQAADLFNVELSDGWELNYYRNWLLGINKTFYPHECKVIMEELTKMSVHYTGE